jgi:hypothetical protein
MPEAMCAHFRAIPDYDATGSSFISHEAADLARPRVADLKAQGAAILCWTIRSPAEEAAARRSRRTSPSRATCRRSRLDLAANPATFIPAQIPCGGPGVQNPRGWPREPQMADLILHDTLAEIAAADWDALAAPEQATGRPATPSSPTAS